MGNQGQHALRPSGVPRGDCSDATGLGRSLVIREAAEEDDSIAKSVDAADSRVRIGPKDGEVPEHLCLDGFAEESQWTSQTDDRCS